MFTVPKSQIALAVLLVALTSLHTQQLATVTISFQVSDSTTAETIPGATLSLAGTQSFNQTTDSNGITSLAIPYGSYNLTISKESCSQIGPQPFSIDQSAPSNILVKLQCQQTVSQQTENPSVQTDKAQYAYNETMYWNASGFAPGAYVQACLGQLCGGVIQADSSGNANGVFLVDQRVQAGQETLAVKNIVTGVSGQTQITISA
jgi:hypothetical protein